MKIDPATQTKFTVLMALVLILAYDLFAVYAYGFDATVSVVVFTLAKAAPIIPFLAGVVVGHLFWPIEGNNGSSRKDRSDDNKE
jgi:uncharacterized integral membrane protein